MYLRAGSLRRGWRSTVLAVQPRQLQLFWLQLLHLVRCRQDERPAAHDVRRLLSRSNPFRPVSKDGGGAGLTSLECRMSTGEYSDPPATPHCEKCPGNSYANRTGASACVACLPGTFTRASFTWVLQSGSFHPITHLARRRPFSLRLVKRFLHSEE